MEDCVAGRCLIFCSRRTTTPLRVQSSDFVIYMLSHLQNFRPAGRSLVLISLFLLNGCATPVLDIQNPTARQYTVGQNVLKNSYIEPSRDVSRGEMLPTVNRVLYRVRNSALKVCKRLNPQNERCGLIHTAGVTVDINDDDINAFADQNNNIGIHGGLVTNMGTDDEIAAILAHEYAHVMHGHVRKRTVNTAIGMLVGATLGTAFESQLNTRDSGRMIADWTNYGGAIGGTVYSPLMEIEADRTAVYILRDAGFKVSGMKDAIIRLSRLKSKQKRGTFTGQVGFLETHPSDDQRVAHIISAIEDASSGVPLADFRR